jgi:hypothetical protein
MSDESNKHVNEEFKALVGKQYTEAKARGLTSIALDKAIGGVTLYINEKPAVVMETFLIDGDTVYVGGTAITTKG